jgi:hypothetical protein
MVLETLRKREMLRAQITGATDLSVSGRLSDVAQNERSSGSRWFGLFGGVASKTLIIEWP